ncbi:hypothetical protein K1719_037804 [Acacia pycnantha]|nr:hypothetical protein K1719_037804 [Acacia pycnantha]
MSGPRSMQMRERVKWRGGSWQHGTEAYRLEVDGSVLRDGRSGCGGVLHDAQGQWICGFSWVLEIRNVSVYSDYIEAINLATRRCDIDYPFKDLVDEVRMLIYRDWSVRVFNVLREEIPLADNRLANFSGY